MIRKVGEEFRDFSLGQNAPADKAAKKEAVTFGKTISVKDASKAVGGNAIQNFFARLQLLVKNKEWMRNKNIQKRLSSHDLKDLIKLDNLFNRAYPDKSKVEDKRIIKFMDKFVSQQIGSQIKAEFFKGTEPDILEFLDNTLVGKNSQLEAILTKNMVRLFEVGITAKDLLDEYPGTEREVLGSLILENKAEAILKDFGLTPEFFAKLEEFSPEPEVQLGLFRAMPEAKRKKLDQLIDANTKALDLVADKKATPAAILAAVNEAIKEPAA